jgi:signal transduction histidine kinase
LIFDHSTCIQLDSCLGLVDDLAFATMFESDNVLQPRPTRMRLRREIEQVLRAVRHQQAVGRSAEQEVRFELNIDPRLPREVATDRSVLRALHNLVSNAVKFGSRGSAVSIAVEFEALAVPGPEIVFESDIVAAAEAILSPLRRASSCRSEHSSSSRPRGLVKFTVSNRVDREMSLLQVHRRFQNYFMYHDSPSPSSSSSERDGDSVSRSSSSVSSGGSNADRRMCEQIAQSLTSNEGLGLGLFVSYNILQSLGGLLECSATPDLASFWFTLEVIKLFETVHYVVLKTVIAGGDLPRGGRRAVSGERLGQVRRY